MNLGAKSRSLIPKLKSGQGRINATGTGLNLSLLKIIPFDERYENLNQPTRVGFKPHPG